MGPIETRRMLRTTIVGLAGLGVFGLILYVMVVAHTGLPFESTTTVRAAFTNTAALKPGDTVRQNAITIGKVDKIAFVDGVSVVTMRIDGHRDFFADARAELKDFSGLGAKYVNLDAGTPAAGPLGDRVISPEKTQPSADLWQFYNVFDAQTRAAGASAERQFGGGMIGHGPDLQAFTKNMADTLQDNGTVSQVLAANDTDLPAFLEASRRISARFTGREHEITEAIEQTDATWRGFLVDNGAPLSATLQKLPETLDTAHQAFDALSQPLADTQTSFAAFQPGAEALGNSERDFRGFLRDSIAPFNRTPDVADQAVPAVGDLSDTFHDARPLAPRLYNFFDNFAQVADGFAPYASDAGDQFVRAQSWASENYDGVRYARLTVDSGLRTLLGGAVKNSIPQNNYPKPGQADFDRVGAPIGGHR